MSDDYDEEIGDLVDRLSELTDAEEAHLAFSIRVVLSY
jgi:hypothetical protein